jgi:hypothetical protein
VGKFNALLEPLADAIRRHVLAGQAICALRASLVLLQDADDLLFGSQSS